jgi:hypothetical protein
MNSLFVSASKALRSFPIARTNERIEEFVLVVEEFEYDLVTTRSEGNVAERDAVEWYFHLVRLQTYYCVYGLRKMSPCIDSMQLAWPAICFFKKLDSRCRCVVSDLS